MKYLVFAFFLLAGQAKAQAPIDSFYTWKPIGLYEKVDEADYTDSLVHRVNPRDNNVYLCKVKLEYVGLAYINDRKQYGRLEKVYVIKISEL